MVMNGLVEIDADNIARPELFESWETGEGAVEWVFQVRQGVTFHNGKTLSADGCGHGCCRNSTSISGATCAASDRPKGPS